MNEYTASNGVNVTKWIETPNWYALAVQTVDNKVHLSGVHVGALREFFRAEEDERLGRWRWSENPDYVVYLRDNGSVTVFQESQPTAAMTFWKNVRGPEVTSGAFMDAARAYFDAHPEPKPWDEAADGEIWALTGAGGLEQPWRRVGDKWISCTSVPRSYSAELATDGRRIWPEGGDA